ncbi:hypothetical protein ABIB40_000279 [Pedobacter sp. UYP30]|uniref:BamA/TamA family outer membrane protein n=1 Tax=Pedobacter sp. UYP30 TaxID=1756400 RepID=UPI00339757ED
MVKKITLVLLFISFFCRVYAQEGVKYRIILIGDAGEMNSIQQHDLKYAAEKVIDGKTTVVYLGDNIYPNGMAIPGDANRAETEKIIKSQFSPMREAGAAVYFVPGNHDWDQSGPNGLAKIKAQSDFIYAQKDSLLKLLPTNGCPDPVAINLTDKLTIIAYDSEWWLFPYNKQNQKGECDCRTKQDVIVKMEDLLAANKGKQIILVSHHPFQSYGPHGGFFSLRDNIFPLTSFSNSLYIPLPIVGSLYPILRTTFLSPEDLNHPLYKDMVKQVEGVFGDYPNVTYAAGHEHGLQLIKNKQLQIVSGSGAKVSSTRGGKYSLFNETQQGFVVADQLKNNDMRYEYYIYADSAAKKVFSYTKKFETIKIKAIAPVKPITQDSILVALKPKYDSVGRFHRFLFGENYRKEFATKVNVPVLRVSELKGGLHATKRGGGNQSKSLRLEDSNGKEWVLRSVEKYPEVLLPPQLRETFAKDIIQDNQTAQNPYSALVVPVLAEASKIPHTNPIIGWVSPDKGLGEFAKGFVNTLCLLEEREPVGESDSSPNMDEKLTDDNDNSVDGKAWLRARALDVLLGDWDRHEDQWRWKETKNKGNSHYTPVPRDRDQVFFRSDGFVQRFAQGSSLLPQMQGYEREIKNIDWFLWEGREISSRLTANIGKDEWDKIIKDFCANYNDQVLERALQRFPKEVYGLHHDTILAQMKQRIIDLPVMMDKYYNFFNRIVDIELTDKNELVHIDDAPNKGLTIKINKISKKNEVEQELFNRTFDPAVTKEIRVYLHDGKDSLVLNNKTSNIVLRIIGGKNKKVYNIEESHASVRLYDKEDKNVYLGTGKNNIRKILSNDTANVSYIPKDMYRRNSIAINPGYNVDDGVLLGLTYWQTNPGFRKQPWGNKQTVSFLHSFATSAFQFNYKGEWLKALGKADVILKGDVYAPDNTQNFFGLGNETEYNRDIKPISYYRTRFNIYQVDQSFRWRRPKSSFSVGPSFQYYRYDKGDNLNKFISQNNFTNAPDSIAIEKDKVFAGVKANFSNDTRDNDLLPALGSYVDFNLLIYKELTHYGHSFGQFTGSISLYKNLDEGKHFVIADRFGGGITFGKPAFYQNLYLGGEGNLLGYRQYRFAGQHSFYNNVQFRAKIGNLVNYILPGQFGVIGFYDVGRVFAKEEESDVWHHGVGGGVYFAPASFTVVRFVMGHSTEGWYPYVGLKFRY